MSKYVLMQMTEMDLFCDEFDKLDMALKAGDYKWRTMSEEDKEDTLDFKCIRSMDPNDIYSDRHFIGIIKKVWK